MIVRKERQQVTSGFTQAGAYASPSKAATTLQAILADSTSELDGRKLNEYFTNQKKLHKFAG